jgi:hypothetical protein
LTRIAGDPSQAARIRVLLTEAAEGGWGIGRIAFGRKEFAALLRWMDADRLALRSGAGVQ